MIRGANRLAAQTAPSPTASTSTESFVVSVRSTRPLLASTSASGPCGPLLLLDSSPTQTLFGPAAIDCPFSLTVRSWCPRRSNCRTVASLRSTTQTVPPAITTSRGLSPAAEVLTVGCRSAGVAEAVVCATPVELVLCAEDRAACPPPLPPPHPAAAKVADPKTAVTAAMSLLVGVGFTCPTATPFRPPRPVDDVSIWRDDRSARMHSWRSGSAHPAGG